MRSKFCITQLQLPGFLNASEKKHKVMDGLKMVRLFLALTLAMTVASQPLETIATSGRATLTTQLWNWAQVGLEAFLEYVRRSFGPDTDEENTTSEHI